MINIEYVNRRFFKIFFFCKLLNLKYEYEIKNGLYRYSIISVELYVYV